MTSQNLHNSSLTQGYQWTPMNTTQTNTPPTVPARGVKRNNPSDCVRTHETTTRVLNRTPDNNPVHDVVLRPQNNMNLSTDCNIIDQMGNNGHDVNVNTVQSPNRVESKLNPMRTVFSWFHGKISRELAEQLLKPRSDGLFLVRESTNFPGDYTLCVCFQSKVEHYRVKYIGKNLTIDDEEIFDNLENLIKHYEEDADGLCTKLIKCLPNDLCVIPEHEIELHEPIGKGEFGEVMLGIWKKNEKVAVKMLKDSSPAEAILMKSLHHENLVNLLGVVRKEGQIYLVTEYMSKGSLVDYLRSRGRLHVTKKDQINFAYHTSAGMEYLERMHVVHRDLAARNVLIAEDGVAKVSDFGLARNKEIKMESAKLPIKWTAPEALKRNIFSNKSDMWSFGILLWEIYSFGRVPYPRIPLADVVKVVEKGYRMEAPEGCPPEIYEIMRQSWDLEPDKRPKFEEIKSKLQALRQQTT